MQITDISFNNLDLLQGLIGKPFTKYKSDPFVFSPSVFGIIGCYIGNDVFKLTALQKMTSRFFTEDNIATFSFEPSADSEIVSMMDNGQMIETPVKDTILSIDLINDTEIVSNNNESRALVSTKGIIFHLTGGNEISFEIGTWFSEFITIRKGYNLIQQFIPTQDFIDEWSDSDGYTPAVDRSVTTIQ